MTIQIGDKCPIFSLKDQHGITVDVSQLVGKKNIVIYFYPKDDTRGCTKEACSFRDIHEDFRNLDCKVIGISSDSVQSHKQFAEKYNLPFTLLSDENNEVRTAFGVPRSLFGLISGRVTYIIDKTGTVRGIFNSLTDTEGHISKAIQTLKSLN